MSIKTDIKDQIQQQVRMQVAANQPKEKSVGGFLTGLKEDITSFGKGFLGLGRKAITEPVESAKTVGSTLFELAKATGKGVPSFINEAGDMITNPIDSTKGLINNYKSLRAIPYEDQKKVFSEFTDKAMERIDGGSRGEKVLTAIGSGLLEDISEEITHPLEFAYEKPFTFGLDVLSIGGGKVLTKGTKLAAQPLKSTKIVKGLEDLFVPNAKLKRAGFKSFGDDLVKTNTNIFNSQKKIIESTAQKFEKVFNLKSSERLEFFETIDKLRRAKQGVKAVSQNPNIQKAINWWLDFEVPKIQKASGLPKEKAITNYLHHFFPEKIKKAEKAIRPLKINEGFLKKSKDVLGFSKDPIVSISAIKAKIATNALKNSFITRTAQKYGQSIAGIEAELIAKVGSKAIEAAKKSGNFKNMIRKNTNFDFFKVKEGVEHILPKTIVDEVNKFYGIASQGDTVRKLLTPLDVFNRNWKPLATAVRPRYHTRNVVGNLYNSIVVGSMNIKNIPIAAKQQLGKYINEVRGMNNTTGKLAKKIFPNKFDTKLIDQAIKDDVVGRGFFSMDLHDLSEAAKNTDDIIKVINKVKNPAEIYKIPILRQYLNLSFNIGQALEDNARLSLYVDRVKRGFSRIEAKEYVNKHLFDYLTGLGEGDKLIKKLIPFWSWQRFNMPLQSETLFTKPIRNMVILRGGQPFVEEVEKTDENVKFFTEEEREQGLLKVGEVENNGKILDKYIRTQSVLPQSDLVRLVDMFKLDFSDIGVNPLFSLFGRLKRNKNYFGKQIERFTGEKVKFLGQSVTGKQKEILGIIPFLSELNKAIGGSFTEDDKPSVPVRLEQVLSPLGTTLKDPENVKIWGLLKEEQELKGSYEQGLESLYKRYLVKSAKNPEEKVFKENVEALEKLLKKKGLTGLDILPIKIRAMKASIQEQIKEQIKRTINKKKMDKEDSTDRQDFETQDTGGQSAVEAPSVNMSEASVFKKEMPELRLKKGINSVKEKINVKKFLGNVLGKLNKFNNFQIKSILNSPSTMPIMEKFIESKKADSPSQAGLILSPTTDLVIKLIEKAKGEGMAGLKNVSADIKEFFEPTPESEKELKFKSVGSDVDVTKLPDPRPKTILKSGESFSRPTVRFEELPVTERFKRKFERSVDGLKESLSIMGKSVKDEVGKLKEAELLSPLSFMNIVGAVSRGMKGFELTEEQTKNIEESLSAVKEEVKTANSTPAIQEDLKTKFDTLSEYKWDTAVFDRLLEADIKDVAPIVREDRILPRRFGGGVAIKGERDETAFSGVYFPYSNSIELANKDTRTSAHEFLHNIFQAGITTARADYKNFNDDWEKLKESSTGDLKSEMIQIDQTLQTNPSYTHIQSGSKKSEANERFANLGEALGREDSETEMPEEMQKYYKGILGQPKKSKVIVEDPSRLKKTKEILKFMEEDAGILTPEDQPFAKESLGTKSKLLAKAIAEEVGGNIKIGKHPFITRVAGEMLKLPLKTLYSLADIPNTLKSGKASAQGFKLPKGTPTLSGREVDTFFKEAEEKIDAGMSPLLAFTGSGSEAILGVAQLGSIAQKTINAIEKKPSLKIIDGKKIDPKMIEGRLNDISQKVDRAITGKFNIDPSTPLAKKIKLMKNTTLKHVDSPGHFYRELAKVIKNDPSFKPEMIDSLGQTTQDFFLQLKADDALIKSLEKQGTSVYIDITE